MLYVESGFLKAFPTSFDLFGGYVKVTIKKAIKTFHLTLIILIFLHFFSNFII
ncbi:MAG: hypothetical protein BAJALOKI3v1_1020009 [Promethearchaeota archaeon]|nr:MAG: hypothetical protein BAJALOKI3v1_1020009 [Candidatus Lokiarchaeota archaeon]